MSGKHLLEITQSTTVPVPLWLLLTGVAGIFTLAFRIHSWETQLRDLSEAAKSSWTVGMEREAWMTFSSQNAIRYPDLAIPKARDIFDEIN